MDARLRESSNYTYFSADPQSNRGRLCDRKSFVVSIGFLSGWDDGSNELKKDFFSPADSPPLLRLEPARDRLIPVELRLPVTLRAGGFLSLAAHGMSVSRVLVNMLFVPLFSFSQVDGPELRTGSVFVHCGIETFGICNLGSAIFGKEGLGSLGSDSFGNENPELASPSESSEILAETVRLLGSGCVNGLTGSAAPAADAVKL